MSAPRNDPTATNVDDLSRIIASFHLVGSGNFNPSAFEGGPQVAPAVQVRENLVQHWTRATRHLGSSAAINNAWFQRIWEAHSDSARYYHTAVHLQEMLSFYDLVRKNDFPPEPSCSPEEDQAILLSTFFHDAVYDVHSGTNEEDSAKLFESFCDEIGLDASNSSLRLLVVDYILATKKHEVVADNPLAQRLFLDLDITVLGKEWQAYCQYAALIRKEYSYVGKPVYCEKRADILESFLLNPIYGTQVMRQAFEDQARSNLRQEIKSLRNGVIPGEDE